MKIDVPNGFSAGRRIGDFARRAGLFFRRPDGVFLICLSFFALTVWAFLPVVQTGFQLYDEAGELINNAHVNSGLNWHNLKWSLFSLEYSNWYPLTWISHMADFDVFDRNPEGHHLTNLLLHAANGVLLFLVLKRMTGALWRSLIVAGLFALHPLRVESVAWITERKDVLSAFFGLLALLFYARYAQRRPALNPQPSTLNYFLALLFFAFGLMSKTMLVTFPFLLLLLDFWPLKRIAERGTRNAEANQSSNIGRLLLEKLPFFLLVPPVSIAAYAAQKAGGQFMLHFPFGFRLESALMGYARYLEKMFWPVNFSVLYPYPEHWPAGEWLLAALFILAVSVLAFALRRQRPYLLVGWLWYLGTLVPVIGFLPLGAQSMSNRYTYLPMIGIALLVVWAVGDLSNRWRGRGVLVTTILALVLGACILRTRGEIVYWKDSASLWSRAVAVTKNNFMAHFCLGSIVWKSEPDKALAEFQASVAIYPDYAEAQRDFAFLLQKDGRFSEAITHYQKAIRLEPQNSWGYNGLGLTLLKMNRVSDAIPPLLKAVEVDPQNGSYKDVLNKALFFSDHETDAVSNFLATARSDPIAFSNFLEAVKNDTNRFSLFNNLAWSFATHPDPGLRNGKYAVLLATRACKMTGYQTANCVETLAAAYAEDGRFDDAISTAQLAGSLATAAGQTDLLKKSRALEELFRSHRPFHESGVATSP
jgi:tetratricopeptide (TPR) repeat protein